MDYRKIEVFLSAVQLGSFSKAADKCYCTQSAVTQLMDTLEGELGVKLLERGHSGVVLTEAGARLLPLFEEAHVALSRLRNAADSERGDVTLMIGSFASIANSWLPEAIAEFSKRFGELDVNVRVGTDTIRDWLFDGKVDVSLGDEWLLDPTQRHNCGIAYKGIRWTPLMEDEFLAVVPSSLASEGMTSIAQKDLLSNNLISAPKNALDEDLVSAASGGTKGVSADDDYAIMQMVANGFGVSVIPRLSLRDVPEGLAVLELEPPTKRILGVATCAHPSDIALEFVRFLEGRFETPAV